MPKKVLKNYLVENRWSDLEIHVGASMQEVLTNLRDENGYTDEEMTDFTIRDLGKDVYQSVVTTKVTLEKVKR